jgi:hypothetical protein
MLRHILPEVAIAAFMNITTLVALVFLGDHYVSRWCRWSQPKRLRRELRRAAAKDRGNARERKAQWLALARRLRRARASYRPIAQIVSLRSGHRVSREGVRKWPDAGCGGAISCREQTSKSEVKAGPAWTCVTVTSQARSAGTAGPWSAAAWRTNCPT